MKNVEITISSSRIRKPGREVAKEVAMDTPPTNTTERLETNCHSILSSWDCSSCNADMREGSSLASSSSSQAKKSVSSGRI